MLNHSCQFGFFVARLLLATVFIFAGISKFLNPEPALTLMALKGVSNPHLLLYLAITIEIVGALSLILGWKTRWGAFVLVVFVIIMNYLMLQFWNEPEGPVRQAEMMNFFKNLSLIGGLLYLLFVGPGRIAIDNHCCSPHCHNPEHSHQDNIAL